MGSLGSAVAHPQEFQAVVGVRVACGRTGHQHGDGARELLLANPVPGELAPVLRFGRDGDCVHAVQKLSPWHTAGSLLSATIHTGGLKREIIRAVVPVRVGTNTAAHGRVYSVCSMTRANASTAELGFAWGQFESYTCGAGR